MSSLVFNLIEVQEINMDRNLMAHFSLSSVLILIARTCKCHKEKKAQLQVYNNKVGESYGCVNVPLPNCRRNRTPINASKISHGSDIWQRRLQVKVFGNKLRAI